ncbi:MAG: ABC transporter substrate-binding protein, partial [Chloroflexota bacterium]
TGKNDIWQGPSSPPEQYMPLFYKLRDEGKVNWFDFLGGSSLDGTLMLNSKPPFNNLKMRQALNLVIDREKMGLAVWGDSLKHPQLMVYSQEAYWSTKSNKEIWNVVPGWGTGAKKQQEIEQAKQLVKDAGYPNGLDLQQMMSTGGGPSAAEAANEFLQQTLAQIGIRTTIFSTTAAQRTQRLGSGTFTIFHYLLRQTTKDPDEIVGSNFVTGAPRNYHGYSNPQVDKLYLQMSSELDQAKRKQLLGQIVDIVIIQDVAFAPDQGIDSIDVWWKRLHGVQIGQTNHSPPGLMRADRLWKSE